MPSVICLLFVSALCAQQGDDTTRERVAFDRVRGSLPRLNRFKLDDEGRLRVDRGGWAQDPDEAEAEADADEKDDEPQGGIRAAGTTPRPIETVLGRIKAVTGTWTRSTSNSSNRSASDFRGKQLQGSYVISGEDVSLQLQELVGKNRTIQLTDKDDTTRFLLYSSAGCIQILRSAQGVHVASSIDGELHSFVGSSFVEVVKKNTAYFHNTLQPALKGVASLPIEDALAAGAPDTAAVSFTDEEPTGLLRSPTVVDALEPLVQLRVVERQLVFNRIYGAQKFVDEDVQRVQSEMQTIVDEAVANLRSAGATGMQIGDFKQQLRIGTRSADQRLPQPAIKMFRDVQHAMKATSSGASWGGTRYDLSFESKSAKGRMVNERGIESIEVSDGNEKLAVVIAPKSSSISVQAATSFTSIVQTMEPAECVLLVIDPRGSNVFRGTTFVSMIRDVPEPELKRTLGRFSAYGIRGFDVFQPRIVNDIAERLQTELPDRFEPDKASTEIETIVFPLMNDAQYLQAVLDRLPEKRRKSLRQRIIKLRRNAGGEK